jgi:hypothetical protein
VSSSLFRRMIEAGAPDFWRLWYVGLVVATVRWVETVAVELSSTSAPIRRFWSR